MNEPPQLLRPARHTSGGQSPTRQRLADDLLAHLSPATVVDNLASATGPLRACLAAASVAEREFAMQCAVASKSIWEWLDELEEWSWPSRGGSAGFEMPSRRLGRALFQSTESTQSDELYTGSLPANDVARYERRVDAIYRELEELAVEDIKNHVLTNHIMPLSRPTTPMSDNRSMLSTVSNYNKMEDLTAVVTAIVVQTLPNLSKLYRLLHTWTVRLSVLQQVPTLLTAIGNAEHALKSGWTALTSQPTGQDGDGAMSGKSALPRAHFTIMKTIIENKLFAPGKCLDYMLDRLEGHQDTLPEDWLDRVETLERGYADWVAACEHQIRAADWTATHQNIQSKSIPPSPEEREESLEPDSSRPQGPASVSTVADIAITLPVPPVRTGSREPSKQSRDARTVSRTGSDVQDLKQAGHIPHSVDSPTVQGSRLDGASDGTPSTHVRPPTPSQADQPQLSPVKTLNLPLKLGGAELRTPEDLSSSSGGEDELELPPLRNDVRRSSDSSQTSTVLHGASSQFGDLSSDQPEVSASPDISNARVREARYVGSMESPPSSPPVPEPESRESSLAPSESLTENGRRGNDDSMLPGTPLEGSFNESYFEDSFTSEVASPSVRRDSSGDQQLQQQISDIIDRIPAKIKLSTEPPNLNPPDLQLPKLKKMPSKEPFKRSVSSLSQRTATPSFTLSPAKGAKPRSRTQQEIKVYHLSRSTGEAPIKLFIRCVGENGERVMVRVGGGWADLSEYLKEYASHHGRRSAGTENAKVEIRDVPRISTRGADARSSPPSRPGSALESPMTPLAVRKTRRSIGAAGSEAPRLRANTPALPERIPDELEPSSEERDVRSRSSSRLSWVEEDSSFLGLAGPSGKKVEMSEENKAWVESVKEKVRLVSGERRVSSQQQEDYNKNKFGELGKVGGTKRLFRKTESQQGHRDPKKKGVIDE